EKDNKFETLIKSISKQDAIPVKISLIPKTIDIAKMLSTLTIQNIKSRRRVAKILAAREVKDSNWNITSNLTRSNIIVSNIEGDSAETVINIQNFLTHSLPSSPTSQSISNETVDDNTHAITMADFSTSSLFPQVSICGAQNICFTYLNMLGWEKFVVSINSLNSHAAIIVRNKNYGEKGKEIIKHFIEE
ncbi:20113_t:CDS:2, partial [Racocetra persica]